ncbi:MAG: site-specific integrase [Bacteroidetes bacterium]|nr:site-specific integrase [Bacteroidota bacterium]
MKINQSTSILFWLFKAKTSADGKTPIYCRITIDGMRSEFSTGKKIETSNWKPKPGEAKGFGEEAVSINRELNKIKAGLQRVFDRLDATNERVTADLVKNTYIGVNPNRKTMDELFTEFNNNLLEKVKANEPTHDIKTWKGFKTTRNKMLGFLKHKYKVRDKVLSEIRHSIGEDFNHYLIATDNLKSNTAYKYIRNAIQVLNYAVRRGYISLNPLKDVKCFYKNPKRERLTWPEIMQMYEKQISLKRLEETRDIYLFGCFTGYSYMDLYNLTNDNVVTWIDGNKWLIKDRTKGDHNKSNVPLMEIPLSIIEKYKNHPYCVANNKLLPVNSNQRFNGYLKEVAIICGIDKDLTTHTARHTFATTVLLENDCPIESTSEMLGHNSIRTTQIYAKTTDVKISNNMKAVKARISSKLEMIKTGS